MIGAGCGAALAVPAHADVAQYPQLADPAIKVRNLTQLYFVAGAVAGSRIFAGGQQGEDGPMRHGLLDGLQIFGSRM